MKSRASLAAAMLVALLALAPPASATHVQCGDVITETTVLDSDLICPTTVGDTGYVALTIAASDVTLWMKKHVIRSQAGYGTGVLVSASGPGSPFTNIQIRNGRFEGWSPAIRMNASDSAVLKVTASEPGSWQGPQIIASGDRNYLARNVVDAFPFFPPPEDETVGTLGISASGVDVHTWGNTFYGPGVWSSGDRPRHVLNTVFGCGNEYSIGIFAHSYSTHAVINRNVVSGCIEGIHSGGLGGQGGARIRLNEVTGNDTGMWIDDATAIVGRNIANANFSDGIVSAKAGTTLQYNTANNNDLHGIFAVPGTVDGGGNVASGNGLQDCVNVQCGP